jgi:hypothetical protein
VASATEDAALAAAAEARDARTVTAEPASS